LILRLALGVSDVLRMEPGPAEASSRLLPQLFALLQLGQGTAGERITRALSVMAEQLDVETAFVSRFIDGQRHLTYVAGAPVPAEVRVPSPEAETVCHLIATGAVGPLVASTAAHPVLSAHPHVLGLGIGAYVGVPLVIDGQVVGAVCGVATAARSALVERDADRLATVGAYIGQVLATSEQATTTAAAAGEPDPGMDVPRLAAVLADTNTLESLTRPLLELVHATTGLESTFLTFVDWASDEQHVLHSLNTGSMTVPEGLKVRWSDTLCRRSLRENTSYTRDVPAVWGDSETARAMGIQTYVSVPITDSDEAVIGTLCGVSSHRADLQDKDLQSMRLFARILAEQFSREQARERETIRLHELEQRTHQLHDQASRDDLTGLLNRAGIHAWLTSVLPLLQPEHERMAVAFIDIDQFKAINDVHGHATGDEVLRRLAASLLTVGRPDDLHGRLGGDEFVVAAVLPGTDATLGNWSERLRHAAALDVHGIRVTASVGIVTFTDPTTTPDTALQQADEAMYQRKSEQRTTSH
jgi:diguanylate cyclase (GGDEF)-like protein